MPELSVGCEVSEPMEQLSAYTERFEHHPAGHNMVVQDAFSTAAVIAGKIMQIEETTGQSSALFVK